MDEQTEVFIDIACGNVNIDKRF